MFGKTILCPFCFNKIPIKSLCFMCSVCVEKGSTSKHIINSPKIDKNGYALCDICGKSTSKKVCPNCKEELPYNILEGETEIISIVGAKNSGKSYYVATLLRQICENGLLARMNQISWMWAVKKSNEEYKKRFKSRLDEQKLLLPTNKITDLVKDNPPILIELTGNAGKKKAIRTFTFFDAAGESFEDEDDLAAITPYLGYSKAVIMILDPRQIKIVDAAVSSHIPGLSQVSSQPYTYVLNNVARIIRDSNRTSLKEKIKIPLCIAFSKWDLLVNTPGLLDPDLMVSQQNLQHFNGYNDAIVNTSSSEIRSLLDNWQPDLVTTAEKEFETVTYFGFSAWGFADVSNGKVPAIASYRVEDPLLWVLHQDGLV